ncbi:MAG: guanylate kinase [Desulfotignum sp.]|nr:guanylate kinase [Desulfotignum sp.]
MEQNGRLFVISAPSGAGKTTLIKQVMGRFPGVSYSVSHTTRPPRPGEIHGKDYFFVSREVFRQMIDAQAWLEWAQVHANFYGTSRTFVREQLAAGKHLLLDIDVQGARQIMDSGLDSVTVFIMPPSLEVLRDRLKSRGTDSPETIALRLENAKKEIALKHLYQYVVINDDLDIAANQLCAIFEKEMVFGKKEPDSNNG